MIVITGGAGFIGSAVVWALNQRGWDDILIVDELGKSDKWKNLRNLKFKDYLEKEIFIEILDKLSKIEAIIHLGACSDTKERDASYLIDNNFGYTKVLVEYIFTKNVHFLYASSAATYGAGEFGYKEDNIEEIRPLNMYGYSKHIFDLWALRNKILGQMVGLKFFNVFGPNEYHKGDMRSVINKKFYEVQEKGKIELFKSYKEDYANGEQKRDFIYIKDAVKMILFFFDHPEITGLFNVGSGVASTWNELAYHILEAMGEQQEGKIDYIDMQEDLRDRYQYYTCADMEKLRQVGYKEECMPLKDAVDDYVKNYLAKDAYL